MGVASYLDTLNKKRGFFAKGDQIRLGIDFLCLKNAIFNHKIVNGRGGARFCDVTFVRGLLKVWLSLTKEEGVKKIKIPCIL